MKVGANLLRGRMVLHSLQCAWLCMCSNGPSDQSVVGAWYCPRFNAGGLNVSKRIKLVQVMYSSTALHESEATTPVTDVNGLLHDEGYEYITLSAARFTKKWDLVLTAHLSVTQSQLDTATPAIQNYVQRIYDVSNTSTPPNFTARANVKWSKILINSVPVGVSSHRGPWTPGGVPSRSYRPRHFLCRPQSYTRTQLGPHTLLP